PCMQVIKNAVRLELHPGAERAATKINNDEFLRDHARVTMTSFVGFHVDMIRVDLMRVLMIGVYDWEVGPCLWEIVLHGEWQRPDDARPWKQRAAFQLGRAYADFVDWARACGLQHSVPPFTLNGLTMKALGDALVLQKQGSQLPSGVLLVEQQGN
ncbi:MAG: hypothetical protein ACKPKO_59120, partial [Candidatus Fonsibacter sp.]